MWGGGYSFSRIPALSERMEWLCLGIMLLIAYAIFMYSDITDTYDNSILFLKAAARGELRSFYSYTVAHARMYWAANYDFMVYIVYGLWNLPVLLISRLRGIDYLDWSLGLLWCKTLGILLTFAKAYLIYKIAELGGTPKKFAALGSFLFLSSAALFVIVFVISQVDGFALFLLLLGFYFYLRGNGKAFLLCYMIAMPSKMFAVFLFLPLVLLKEKRIPCIFAALALSFSGSILSKLLFGADPAYHFALGSQSRDAVIQIMESSVFMGQVLIPFLICYMGICVFCYLYNGYKENRERHEIPVFCAAAVWGSFVCFINFNSYWVIYLIPFLILATIMSGRYLKACCLLEIVFSLGYLGVVLSVCTPLADPNLARRLLLPKLISVAEYDQTKYGSLNYMFERLGGLTYAPLFSTCMAGSLLILLILTCPFLPRFAKRFEPLERTVLWSRLGCLAAVLAVLLYACTAKAPLTRYSTFAHEKAPSEWNLLPGSVIEQTVEFDEDCEISELSFYFSNPDYVRNNFCSLGFELIAKSTGEIVYEDRIGCSMIRPDERLDLKLKGMEVRAGEEYVVRVTGLAGIRMDRMSGRSIFPWVTDGLADPAHPAYVNGERQPFNLFMRIR